MNNISKMHEIIGKQYMELCEVKESSDFWYKAYTNLQEEVKAAEMENAKLREELENVKAELEQQNAEHETLLDRMLALEMGAADTEEAGEGEAV